MIDISILTIRGDLMKNHRNTIVKGLLALAAVIVIFTSISKLFLLNSETLAEHAAKNTPAPVSQATPVPTDTPPPEDAYHIEETPTPAPTEDPAVQIMKEFYYAPLSEEQKTYITGCSYPENEDNLAISYEDLSYIHILHYDFEGNLAEGELICNNYIAQDLLKIFYELYLNEYRLERVTLIENYNGDDTLSMADNNTSCFNYRVVDGTTNLSKHAYGLAIDINPFYNPYVTYPGGKIRISPPGSEPYADRSADFPYKIDENDLCYKLFKEHGFTWGGDWNSSKDYQHFQKTIN
jgi:hypothetical protein